MKNTRIKFAHIFHSEGPMLKKFYFSAALLFIFCNLLNAGDVSDTEPMDLVSTVNSLDQERAQERTILLRQFVIWTTSRWLLEACKEALPLSEGEDIENNVVFKQSKDLILLYLVFGRSQMASREQEKKTIKIFNGLNYLFTQKIKSMGGALVSDKMLAQALAARDMMNEIFLAHQTSTNDHL